MLTLQQATQLTVRLYGVTLTEISTLPSYNDQNFFLVTKEDNKYVLKIMNSKESMNPTRMEVQTLAMSFLHQRGVPSQIVVPTTTGKLMSMEEIGNGNVPPIIIHNHMMQEVKQTTGAFSHFTAETHWFRNNEMHFMKICLDTNSIAGC